LGGAGLQIWRSPYIFSTKEETGKERSHERREETQKKGAIVKGQVTLGKDVKKSAVLETDQHYSKTLKQVGKYRDKSV